MNLFFPDDPRQQDQKAGDVLSLLFLFRRELVLRYIAHDPGIEKVVLCTIFMD